MKHTEVVGTRSSPFEKFRPYVPVPSSRSIVPTELGEEEALMASAGVVSLNSAKVNNDVKGASAIVNTIRFKFGSDEQYEAALKALKNVPTSKEKPRSTLAF